MQDFGARTALVQQRGEVRAVGLCPDGDIPARTVTAGDYVRDFHRREGAADAANLMARKKAGFSDSSATHLHPARP